MNVHTQTRILVVGLSAMLIVASGAVRADDAKLDDKTAWHGDVAFGLALAKGNSDTLLMNAEAKGTKVWSENALALGVDGQYGLNDWGKSNEVKSASNVHGFTEYKRLFTDRFYGSARIDGYHDDVADLHYRLIVGPAAGYYFIKSDATKLSGEIGPSFITEKQGSNTMSFVTLRVSERGEHSFTKTSKVWEQVDYLPQIDDFKNYLVNAEVGAEAAISARLSLRVVATDKFNNEPPKGILRNDISLVSSVVYKY